MELRSNPSFVRLFVGRVVTNAGDSLYAIAAMWLVYDLTGSTFYTGVASFLTLGPQALQFLAGPLVDRWSLRRVLVSTQAVQAVGVLAVPVAAATGHLSVWVVLFVMPVLSMVSQFDSPAMNAALPHVVEDDQLVKANSLFSTAGQSLDTVFNALSGALVAVVGAVTIYLIDAVTFVVALVLFLGLAIESGDRTSEAETDDASPDAPVGDYFDQLREGFDYLRGSAVASIVLGAVVVNFTFGVMMAVLPAFAEALGGPETYGLLMASVAAGNLAGSAGSSLVEEYPFGLLSVASFTVSTVCLLGAVSVPGVPATVVGFFGAFVPAGAFNVIFFSMLQSAVDDAMLARVTSVVSSGSTAMMPVGSLLGGTMAGALGVSFALYGTVASMGFLVVYFLVRPGIRLLPPVADADERVLGLG
ncbi:MFS transporter [Halorussus sp. MSC15.2]|uniref:MFS transporter n=1 Tax=Halorussus sp. MSC15.2 TaxID=2283638 RepID=UPI0013D81737|nr:MFS transporter [Halorussus sp. MSC15.2]NEU57076.1 MFS transporter [Halorussus sp. MSC15.2]